MRKSSSHRGFAAFMLCLAAALLLLPPVGPAFAQTEPAMTPATEPTAAEAKAFVEKAEAELAREGEYLNRVQWVQNTYITDDTNWLVAKANAESTALSVRYAKEAARFDGVAVDPVVRRKLALMKQALVLPAPSRPGAGQELAEIQARLDTLYATGKFTYRGRPLTLDDMEDLLRTSRDPAEIRALWEGWRLVSPPMKADYARLVSLANEGARELGYADTGALWRSWYDMPPDEFAQDVDRLWSQVEPFYRNLHCYVRARLNERYGDAVQPRKGPIRADLLGDMWGQTWGNIYDIVAPTDLSMGYDLTEVLRKHGYDPVKMVKTGEGFYTSLGFDPLPRSFWDRSMITRPPGREVVCHASAWDIDNKSDIRLKACIRVNDEDFFTVHHELGHNMYQRAYRDQPFLFENGANDGFHEAIGDFAGLNALTPTYLHQLGLIDAVPGPDADLPYLLKIALDKIAFLPFGLLVDKWRWEVFAGRVTPAEYNESWWALVRRYQGMVPPGPRPADAFDPGAKFHIADNTPYARYFLADVYEFQFYRAACRMAGWTGPLNRCSIYGNREVGRRFEAMLRLGQSRPWQETLAVFTGEHDLDASAIIAYFAPLDAWLTRQNAGETCGW
jgi:peptidyl-dipeptidase A